MKAVLISIKPKYCELIASGKKTIEVRKSVPKLETPFKVYIYCTKDKYQHLYDLRPYTNGEISLSLTQHNKTSLVPQNYWNGKVIGEFVCDRIDIDVVTLKPNGIEPCYWKLLNGTCLTKDELMKYGKYKALFGWHISNLLIYDKPKDLSEFKKAECDCPFPYVYMPPCPNCDERDIKRPPQSWCYVEV